MRLGDRSPCRHKVCVPMAKILPTRHALARKTFFLASPARKPLYFWLLKSASPAQQNWLPCSQALYSREALHGAFRRGPGRHSRSTVPSPQTSVLHSAGQTRVSTRFSHLALDATTGNRQHHGAVECVPWKLARIARGQKAYPSALRSHCPCPVDVTGACQMPLCWWRRKFEGCVGCWSGSVPQRGPDDSLGTPSHTSAGPPL